MKERRVRFTETAARHVASERTWWWANRDHLDAFAEELQDAVQVVSILPGAGSAYTESTLPGVRRVYLRKTGCHLYYTFDDDEVIVRALWGARRARGPAL